MPIGQKLLLLTLSYNLAVPLWAYIQRYKTWQHLWQFAAAFGVFNIFPDWFLSAYLKTLYYPNEGIFKIGTIGGYMPFLWFVPIFMILFIGQVLKIQKGRKTAYWAILSISAITYVASEHSFQLLDSWHAINVRNLFGNAAIYVLIAEMFLMLAAFWLFEQVENQSLLAKIVAAFSLMLFYFGSLCFCWFWVEY
jgi:hypothetical protein